MSESVCEVMWGGDGGGGEGSGGGGGQGVLLGGRGRGVVDDAVGVDVDAVHVVLVVVVVVESTTRLQLDLSHSVCRRYTHPFHCMWFHKGRKGWLPAACCLLDSRWCSCRALFHSSFLVRLKIARCTLLFARLIARMIGIQQVC